MARDNGQNRQKCCDNHSPFKSMSHKRNNFPCSMIITQTSRRRISTPQVFRASSDRELLLRGGGQDEYPSPKKREHEGLCADSETCHRSAWSRLNGQRSQIESWDSPADRYDRQPANISATTAWTAWTVGDTVGGVGQNDGRGRLVVYPTDKTDAHWVQHHHQAI